PDLTTQFSGFVVASKNPPYTRLSIKDRRHNGIIAFIFINTIQQTFQIFIDLLKTVDNRICNVRDRIVYDGRLIDYEPTVIIGDRIQSRFGDELIHVVTDKFRGLDRIFEYMQIIDLTLGPFEEGHFCTKLGTLNFL